MTQISDYINYQRYLASKKSVDDRALNALVWQALGKHFDSIVARRANRSEPIHILELGSGIGTMLERFVERGLLSRKNGVHSVYVAVDELATNQETAADRLSCLNLDSHGVQLILETAELFDYLGQAKRQISNGEQKPFDLVIAHAFLDLVDASAALQSIKAVMQSNGLLFTSINFDGATILQPEVDPAFDVKLEALYHKTMDERVINGKRSGESRTGRHLFGHLLEAGFDLQEAGASDWVVFAVTNESDGQKVYTADEAYFLHFIVETMHGALKDDTHLDQEQFAAWTAERHRQIKMGELVYIAHQLDFLALNR